MGRPIYELLEHQPPMGFSLLPAPSAGDVFFDMEGDPLYEPGRGLEYLFGCWMADDDPPFRAFWGVTRAEEKTAFEAFVDFVTERRRRYASLHVYHYSGYEKSALRRLAQQHRTRENEVDALLREGVLVDLYAVVRQSLVISEDGYGLKKLERFYDYGRATEVRKGDDSIVMFERWMLEKNPRVLADIEAYNRDDCRSTQILRDWLMARRLEAAAAFGVEFPFYEHRQSRPSLETQEEEDRRSDLERRLLDNVLLPRSEEEYELMSDDRRARYLLGGLLAYHAREAKPQWWTYFDRCENVDTLLEFDREPIAGLQVREEVPVRDDKRSKIYTYSFPDQNHKMGPGDAENPRTKKKFTILSIDDERNRLELRTTAAPEVVRAIEELIPPGPPPTKPQHEALERIAEAFLGGELSRRHPATADLLLRRPPRLTEAGRIVQPVTVDEGGIARAAGALDRSYLFIQGPPGSGKSTYGAATICNLLARGKRIAVTSTSHAAIHNLLHKVEARMRERGLGFRGLYKHSSNNEGSEFHSKIQMAMIESVDSNGAFGGDGYDLAGGTAWLLAREEFEGKFDYLFIDEAGQVALADALALSLCARNVVLLGDPSQLAQVSQGHHGLHVGDSVLEHLLAGHRTVPPDRGVFLNVSYRMQSEICAFVSDAMYEGRLQPSPKAAAHHVAMGDRRLAGLYFAPVAHSGNASSSPEEAAEIVARILRLAPYERDVIVVTPYNAQRRLIASKLAEAGLGAVRVGTVDKFQGQEAAVVFYSMATSSGDEMPRDMEFLFERNRFNVAISRARTASVLVCSPRLLDISCRTPAEMALANLLCAFAERAVPADW
jgi:uncharacterized protein